MTNTEMNRRIAALSDNMIAKIERLIRNGYNARDIYNFRIGAKLSQINAVFQKNEAAR